MGLYITYDSFDASYASFHRLRKKIALKIGIPLELMQGFYCDKRNNIFSLLDYTYNKGDEIEMYGIKDLKEHLPLKWDSFRKNPLHEFLYHSDCEGYINYSSLKKITPELELILNKTTKEEDVWFYSTLKQLINGFKEAIKDKKRVDFR